MFTGIIETLSEVIKVEESSGNMVFTLQNPYPDEIYIDQSISHNGVCLTVIDHDKDQYQVEAIKETLSKTNLSSVSAGDKVNLERSLLPSSRIDGHFVQGHVDCTGKLTEIINENGSWELSIQYPKKHELLLIEKGSVCLNGISLTITDIKEDVFKVAIIPYTYEHTNIKYLKAGSKLNIEFDSMGKYVVNYLQKTNSR